MTSTLIIFVCSNYPWIFRSENDLQPTYPTLFSFSSSSPQAKLRGTELASTPTPIMSKRTLLISPLISNDSDEDVLDITTAYREHSFFHPGDSGLDLFCVQDQEILPGQGNKIGLGIAVSMRKIKADGVAKTQSCLLLPRSSIIKTPLRLANSMGLIDAGYRGELMAVVDNNSPDPFLIKKGDRFFQIIRGDLKSFNFEVVAELEVSERGNGGFGSTGQ